MAKRVARSRGMAAALQSVADELKSLGNEDRDRQMQSARRVADAVAAFEKLAEHRAPTETWEAHLIRVHRAAEQLKVKINQARQDHGAQTGFIYARVNAEMIERAALTDHQYGREVRDIFRAMSEERRLDALGTVMKQKDTQFVGAILGVPHFLTGMSKETHLEMTNSYLDIVAPDHVAQLAEVMHSNRVAKAIFDEAELSVNDGMDPQGVAELTRQEARASEARSAFSASTGSTTE